MQALVFSCQLSKILFLQVERQTSRHRKLRPVVRPLKLAVSLILLYACMSTPGANLTGPFGSPHTNSQHWFSFWITLGHSRRSLFLHTVDGIFLSLLSRSLYTILVYTCIVEDKTT